MELITILNRCHRFRGFVYQHAHFSPDKKSIEVAVRLRKGSVAVISVALLACTSCAQRYAVTGMVLAVNPTAREFTVSHHDIGGYMPAMVMPFQVAKASDIAGLVPGDRVAFRLSVTRTGSRAEKIVRRGVSEPQPAIGSQADFKLPAPLAIGSAAPDFTLISESGKPLRLADLRGQTVILNFLYTRCPLPDVCPRQAANFARLQRRFEAQLGHDLTLLSITIDPQYDTPEVLSAYARRWRARAEGWHFLTGSVTEIRAVAEPFGLIYWPEDSSMTHNSETVIISREGTLAAQVRNADYPVSQLGDLVESVLRKGESVESSKEFLDGVK